MKRSPVSPVRDASPPSRPGVKLARIVVMVSGAGSNLQVLLDACAAGEVPGAVVGVVSNRASCRALERARTAGVATCAVSLAAIREGGGTREDFDRALAEKLESFAPDLIVMAGFMHVLSPGFFNRFPPTRIVNLHPSLLPEDPSQDRILLPDGTEADVLRGHDAVAKALSAKVAWTGTSIHYVTADVDRGPLIARRAVRVEPDDTADTLRERIQAAEHIMLPHVVAALLGARGFARA